MIPKIIHYCWFGGNPYPQKIKDCIGAVANFRVSLPKYN
jgi:mannosyltransferase OCH1-like enzyme